MTDTTIARSTGPGPLLREVAAAGARVRVFEYDEALLDGVPLSTARRLASRVLVPRLRLGVGAWDPTPPRGARGVVLGALVLDGLLERTVDVSSRAGPELLGPGDVVRPWDPDAECSWEVHERVDLAVLDDRSRSVLGVPTSDGSIVRVLLADDHQMVRHGLRLTLEAEPGFVVSEAADGVEAVRRGSTEEFDLAVLDVSMPLLTGIQAARQLSEHRPDLPVLVLSAHDNEQFFFEALRAGASGYVLKSAAHEDLVAACHAALRGEPFLHPRGVAALVREYLERDTSDVLEDPLSPRESEVVKLIAEGMTSREIGELLSISAKTVERHRSNVLGKLGLRDRVALTRYAIRRGLVEP